MTTSTPALIRAQIGSVLEKFRDATVIGIRTNSVSEPVDSVAINSETLALAYSDSVLEIRERISDARNAGERLVVLTSLDEMELGADVVSQLAQRHLFSIEPWQILKHQFRANWIDPRLVERHAWVAGKLLECIPAAGFAPVPSGYLEAETAWKHIFQSSLGMKGGRRDPSSLLEWALEEGTRPRVSALSTDEAQSLASAVEESEGALAGRIFGCILQPQPVAPIAIGVVLRVLFGGDAKDDMTAARAAVRVESFVGGPISEQEATAWADASEGILGRMLERDGYASIRSLVEEADELLSASLHTAERADRSRFLPSGFESQMSRLSALLLEELAGAKAAASSSVWERADELQSHALAKADPRRITRVRMAIRLANWLMGARESEGDESKSFQQWALDYRADTGFADRARAAIVDGDSNSDVSGLYSTLLKEARERRESINERFGSKLAHWSEAPAQVDGVIPIERFLEEVAAPIAERAPILIGVIDGMSMAVFRQLEEDLGRNGWIGLAPNGTSAPKPVISAIPSVTEASRASLFAGALTTGAQAQEAKAFSKHPKLTAVGKVTKPPLLFHKGSLVEQGKAGLAPAVGDALTDPSQRIVGVVINAVDDHLAKGDQVRVPWGLDSIRPLDSVLTAAREAGRVVLLLSDHGHVIDYDTTLCEGTDAERWRAPTSDSDKARAGEVEIRGPRVMLTEAQRLIAPWSEKIRYASKKNGYHGGVSPQEVIIPLGVFSAGSDTPDGWHEVDAEKPAWWARLILDEPTNVDGATAEKTPKPKKPKTSEGQGTLFPTPSAGPNEPESTSPTGPAAPAWIAALLESEIMAMQKRQAARTALPDQRVSAILTALDERGGKMTRAALATKLKVPTMRISGLLSALRRLLNVDGYSVLSVDEASDTIELNRELLEKQFELN